MLLHYKSKGQQTTVKWSLNVVRKLYSLCFWWWLWLFAFMTLFCECSRTVYDSLRGRFI